ncbi:DUF4145 domain-containing protein [Flectobacillus roseus]|uniref:DUF4145 domain-containing protein n=1 Tax=Flectobacillus roseus TaxID=502259 RepID=UPI0036272F22
MTKSNFIFLASKWPEMFQLAQKAELEVFKDPSNCCFLCRKSLEGLVKWVISQEYSSLSTEDIKSKALYELEKLLENTNEWRAFERNISTIRKYGNVGVHGEKALSIDRSLLTVKNLFYFSLEVARRYDGFDEYVEFDEKLLNHTEVSKEHIDSLGSTLQQIQEQITLLATQNQKPQAIYSQPKSSSFTKQSSQTPFDQAIIKEGFKVYQYYETYKKDSSRKITIAQAEAKLQELGWPQRDAHLSFQPFRNLQSGTYFTMFGDTHSQQEILRVFIQTFIALYGEQARANALASLRATMMNRGVKWRSPLIEELVREFDI